MIVGYELPRREILLRWEFVTLDYLGRRAVQRVAKVEVDDLRREYDSFRKDLGRKLDVRV